MARPRASSPAVLALAAALVLPSCGEDNPAGLPDVPRAGIIVLVDPNPIEGLQSPLTGSVSVSCRALVAEINGLGGEVIFVSATIFDPETGAQAALTYFDSNDLSVFVGDSRIEPGGSLEVPLTMTYVLPDFRKEAELTVSVQVRDDRDNLLNSSILVKVL